VIKRDLYYERIPTKSLREDVRFLGNSLGNVIKEQEGKSFYNLVEKIRKLSKANKIQKKSYKKISSEIKSINPKNTYKLARAFNHFMNFINLAESIDASRQLNQYENKRDGKNQKNIFIEEIFEKLFKNKKINNNKIYSFAKNLNME
jgi:Phosphoenolpyruvate carboxylase